MKEKIEKPFCVIGECVSFVANRSKVGRKWFATVDEAVAHGGEFMADKDNTGTLRVVEVVRVVRRKADYVVTEVEK